MSDDLTGDILRQQLKETQDLLESTKQLLARPVNVKVDLPPAAEQATLKKIAEYLPQLTHMSSNLSHVASAVQASNAHAEDISKQLKRIADALEQEKP